MNENLDLFKILRDCPKGTKLFSAIHGEVAFDHINYKDEAYPIVISCTYGKFSFTRDGKHHIEYENGECTLFPSKDQRDWSKFKAPVEKFDYNTLQPFDKVLVRDGDCDYWRCGFFSRMLSNGMLCECRWDQGIPYNDETNHLLGTCDMPDEKYIWWED